MGNNLNFAGDFQFGCFRIDLEFYLGHFCAPAFRQQRNYAIGQSEYLI
jgi:hypothetical protein